MRERGERKHGGGRPRRTPEQEAEHKRKRAEESRRYRAEHPDRVAATFAKWMSNPENREKRNARQREREIEQAEEIAARKRERRANRTPEEIEAETQYYRNYRATHHDEILEYHREYMERPGMREHFAELRKTPEGRAAQKRYYWRHIFKRAHEYLSGSRPEETHEDRIKAEKLLRGGMPRELADEPEYTPAQGGHEREQQARMRSGEPQPVLTDEQRNSHELLRQASKLGRMQRRFDTVRRGMFQQDRYGHARERGVRRHE